MTKRGAGNEIEIRAGAIVMGRRAFMPQSRVFDPVSMDFVSGCPILKSVLWSGKKFSADFVNLGGAGALFYWGFEVDKVDKLA
ncbi:hypothetical protein [Rhodobacter capsulatus]|uniref:hypothetical protein n=1 Tax=Rhodobacter capsulatus TaxID=1061 RepID=UPI0003D3707D|nr:hypothetical protein [Rhodobacter capsulatus]ETD87504.1 hypothetical protein U716_00405 [Rhodobacter capsulatus B6]